jgi:hypothetical protein
MRTVRHDKSRSIIPQWLWKIIRPKGSVTINALNAELNPICHLLTLLQAHHILHVSRIRVNAFWAIELLLLFCRARWLMPPDVTQPVRPIVLTLLQTFKLSPLVVSRVYIPRAILVAKAGTMRARNGRLILSRRRLPRNEQLCLLPAK